MVYKYFPNKSYENFSSGRVIYHKPKYPNYPVRLAGELFHKCLEYSKKKSKICLYDPCCGSAYAVTVLGYLCNEFIDSIYCSDISSEAVELSHKNLLLLSYEGIEKRKNELESFKELYKKETHKKALKSMEEIKRLIKHEIKTNVFLANVLNEKELMDKRFVADIIITDVPYGSLVTWSSSNGNETEKLLEGIVPVINLDTVIAISHNKQEKIDNSK